MFRYEDGKLFWKSGRRAGLEAGFITERGYWKIAVHGSLRRRARIVWEMFNGEIRGQIDHINGDRSDDRIENLRDVSPSFNQQNRRAPQANSKTGFLGASRNGGGYIARIRVGGVRTYIGRFGTAELASAAYLAAKERLHPGFVSSKRTSP